MKIFRNKYAVLAMGAVLSLTSCIDETFPESSTVTEDQMSNAGLSSAIAGLSSQYVQGYLVYGEQEHETDMAYPQFMIAQTEMMGDMYALGSNTGYDWYRTYNTMDRDMSGTSYFSWLPWRTLYMFVKGANDAIKTFKSMPEPTDENKNYAAMAYAYRAYDYYMLTILFEPVANKYTDCSKVLGLTVPIITEETTEEEAANNPRATHDKMMEFILSDLDAAEKIFTETDYKGKDRTAPSLAVVYGLKAKTYMWDQKYDKALEYAEKAIKTAEANGAAMMTKQELTSPTSAFATATSGWLWYSHYSAENMGNLCNYTGWISGEADWGYSSLTCPGIDKSLYDKMGINDYRRKWFLDPARKRGDYETCRDEDWLASMPDYLSIKFRCAQGDYKTYSIGGAVDVPIMRLEELYLIQAEATGLTKGYEEGARLLKLWVNSYRDAAYKCRATNIRELQLAVLDQMRIEFWGEGNAFPSAKRIKPGVMQYYKGPTAPAVNYNINAEGIKPNWNLCIPDFETQVNSILIEQNNPDPTLSVDGSKCKEGVYAEGKY